MLRRLRSIFADLLEEISAALPFDRRMERPRAPSAVARGFILDGTHYPVDKWIDLLRELLRILASRHPEQLHLVLALGEDRLRPPFTRDPSALNRSEVIPGTDIYMNLQQGSTGRVTDLAIKTAGLFGYGPDRFAILEPD